MDSTLDSDMEVLSSAYSNFVSTAGVESMKRESKREDDGGDESIKHGGDGLA